MDTMIHVIGVLAAGLTSLSYLPQVRKAYPRGSTHDLSLKMLVVLASGLGLWVGYGVLRGDWVVTLANLVGASLCILLIGFKVRDMNARSGSAPR